MTRFHAPDMTHRMAGLGVISAGPLAQMPAGGQLALTGGGLVGIGGSALYGAGIGYVASGKGKGAATGALAGASVSSLAMGLMNVTAQSYLPGALFLGLAGVGGYYAYKRFKSTKRGR